MKHFCLHCGKELSEQAYICPSCHHNSYLDSLDDKMVQSSFNILPAINIELNTQWAKYRCGKEGSAGHGFAAEDYNALADKLSGFNVNSEGRDNKKDGADRIVDGTHIQVKYCATPQNTINAAFTENGAGGYRYFSNDGSPQILEVPADQYDKCLQIMENKIQEGKIKNIGSRSAKDIVKKGNCTYEQAKNITRAGNIDSLTFDIKTGSVVALSSLGISFCVKLGISATTCKNIDDFKTAVQMSFLEGLQSGTITLSTSVFTTQVLKTEFGRKFVSFIHSACKGKIDTIYGTSLGKEFIHDIAKGMWQKSLYGVSAKNTVTRLVRLNAVTNSVVFLITSIPDTYRFLIKETISRPQFIKNLIINASSITGASGGAILGLKLGKPGAIIGGMIGGSVGGYLSKTIMKKITKDDEEHMQELIKIAFLELANEFCMQSQTEFESAVRNIQIDKVIDTNLLRAMYTVGHNNNDDIARVEFAKLAFQYQFGIVARQRPTVHLLENEKFILDSINDITVSE